ncbi:peptidase inhibitor family I36 protein [Micromonospora humida]|uniref:peptidase inhibitor family I36 protein n=1 Tax=Micromonospora humida TaxID=2809018 RepID=UPI0034323901
MIDNNQYDEVGAVLVTAAANLKEKTVDARTIVATGAVLGVLGLLGAPGSPAVAKEQPRNCAVNVDTRVLRCADTEAHALRAVGATQASVVIARTYDGTGFSGALLTWAQSGSCTPEYDAELQWDDLRTTSGGNWNNRITSVRTYNQCDVKFFDGINFTGAQSVWIDEASNLATIGDGWNNRAGSIKFS